MKVPLGGTSFLEALVGRRGAGEGGVIEDVVARGLEHRWTFRILTAVLRGTGRAGAALPPLVRVLPARVLLPRYQWQILRLLAARRSRSEGREIIVSVARHPIAGRTRSRSSALHWRCYRRCGSRKPLRATHRDPAG